MEQQTPDVGALIWTNLLVIADEVAAHAADAFAVLLDVYCCLAVGDDGCCIAAGVRDADVAAVVRDIRAAGRVIRHVADAAELIEQCA